MKIMRKEIADLIHEAMEQHELARDFYHRLAHRFAAICQEMSERAHRLGPSPVKQEARAVWQRAQQTLVH